jgi:mRNA interferase RelE/StbE
MYSVVLTEGARDAFERAEASLQRRLDRCFDVLKLTPRHHPNIKPLKGDFAGALRFRVGDYRVIYRIDDAAKRVIVVDIAHRRDVYE